MTRRSGRRAQLHRALSKQGVCSRAAAAGLVRQGRVKVNGQVVKDPLWWVDLDRDRLEVKATAVKPLRPVYLALNKPAGYVTTASDDLGRPTVYDLLPERYRGGWLFPVGRLDLDSEGLLLFTNDGAWADRLTSPASHVAKTYVVDLNLAPAAEELARLRAGIMLDGARTRPAEIQELVPERFEITLTEGRNRQVRRMFESVGCNVLRLTRLAIGRLALGRLPAGKTRELTAVEIEQLP